MQGEQGNTYHFSSPFIGREDEIALFKDFIQNISTHGRYLLLISGRPGIGKSRLLEELYKTARRRKTHGVEPLLASYRFREETSLAKAF